MFEITYIKVYTIQVSLTLKYLISNILYDNK